MLAGVQREATGQNGLDRTELVNDCRWNIFKFERDEIHAFGKFLQCGGILIGGIGFTVCDLTRGAGAVRLVHIKTVAEGAPRQNQHAAQLATA